MPLTSVKVQPNGSTPKTDPDKTDPGGEYQVYRKRWLVLIAYGLPYLMWCWTCSRYAVIASTSAQYHNTTNNMDFANGELGIDFVAMSANLGTVITYLPAGYMVRRLL